MFKFSGNIVIIEKVRAVVGGAVLGGMAGGFLVIAFNGLKKRKCM